jgi:hypothetical protein
MALCILQRCFLFRSTVLEELLFSIITNSRCVLLAIFLAISLYEVALGSCALVSSHLLYVEFL